MGDVILTGLAANDPVPGNYLEINFAQGAVAGANVARSIILVGNRLSTAPAVLNTTIYGPDTPTVCVTEGDVIALFGAGSELHRMWRAVTAVNKQTAIYLLAITESAGANATGVFTFATTATGSGVARLSICEEVIEYSFATGETPTNIADAMVLLVNARKHLPVTAANVAGALTLTAKQKGPRGNELRFLVQVVATGSVGTTVTPTVQTAFTGGTTADSLTAALATLVGKFFYQQVFAPADTTNAGLACAQIDSMALPITGKRQRAFFGHVGTVSAANAVAVARNTARAEIIWSENNPLPASEIAAQAAAVYAFEEIPENPRTNFIGYGSTSETQVTWQIPGPRDDADNPTRAEVTSALNNGVTPLAPYGAGKSQIVNRITTRSLNGATADYRIRPAHKVTICDRFADDLLAKLNLQYNGFRIADDPPKGKSLPGPKVLCPAMLRAAYIGLLDIYDGRALLQGVDATKETLVVQRGASNRARMETRARLNPIDNFEQSANALDQV